MPSMGHLATWESDARTRLITAADTLAHRLGRPAFNTEARAARDPVPTAKSVGDLELTATLAEAVVRLTEELDELRVQLASRNGGVS
jgi:hypothetical protein